MDLVYIFCYDGSMELTPQQVLALARKWQLDPMAEKQDLNQEDNKKIPVLRKDELAKIQEITKLNVSQTDFNHAFGWIVAEGKILDFIEKEFQNESNPELLEQLKREKDLTDKKKTTWEKHHQKNQQRFQNRTNEEEIQKFTDRDFVNELKPEEAQLTGGKREIQNVSLPASQPLPTTRVLTKVQVGVSGGNNWRTYFIHPEQYFGKAFSAFKNSLARVFGKKEVAGTVATGVAKTGFKAALTKLGAFIPTGVTQAIAIVSTAKDIVDKFIPKELQEKLKDLWSAIQIGMVGVAGWLLMNLGALAGGIIGGIIGGTMGAALVPFLGPLAPVVGSSLGFTVGAFVGYSLQGIASSILGLGGGSAAGGTAGLSAAASSFGALLSGSGLSTIALFGVGGGLGLVSLFTVLTIITVGATQPSESSVGQNGKTGFKVELTASPEIITVSDPKDEATITYTITITKLENNVEIKSVNEKISKDGIVKRTQSLPITQTQSAFSFKAGDYNGSRIISAVTVTGRSEGATEDDTQTATAVVSVGNVSANQPYGYPAAGKISSLDLEPCVPNGCHFGTFLPSRAKVWGGVDIAQSANNPVYSTIEGVVDRAEFDNALGGVVYIRSFDGQYKAAFLHLDSDLKVKNGDSVGRGTLLGKVYAGLLPTSTGPHVHYQVLLNNGNQLFQNNFGSCLAGKILPNNPRPELYQLIDSSGPFVCQ